MQISVGEHAVTITPRSGTPIYAEILEKRRGPDGTVYSVLLDRVVATESYGYRDTEWEPCGVFVTELRRRGYDPTKATPPDGRRAALLAVLGDEHVVESVERAVEASAHDGWRDHLMKRRTVEGAVAAAVGEHADHLREVMEVLAGE